MDRSQSDSIEQAIETAEIFEERVAIPFEDGTMEGELVYDPLGETCDAVLLLSPHPNFAGTMDNNVICALSRQFGKSGYAVLRFNYPGVGASTIRLDEHESSFDFWDAVEREQRFEKAAGPSREALAYLREAMGPFVRDIHLVGYSFGGVVAMIIAGGDDQVRTATAISMPWISRYDYEFLECVRVPKFFVSGDRDFAFDREVFERVWPKISGPKEFHPVENDHFFRQSEERLAQFAIQYFTKREAIRRNDF